MRWSHLINPLQWNFGIRTVATLFTWALLPVFLTTFVAFRRLGAAAQTLGLSAQQLQALESHLLQAVLWVEVPIVIVVIGASILFAYVVVKPLARLKEAMQRVAQGDLSQTSVVVTSRDEVGQATRSYNLMASQLAAMVRTLAQTASDLERAAAEVDRSAREADEVTEASSREIANVETMAAQQAEYAADGARAIREVEEAAFAGRRGRAVAG
ncbi:MAG: hypothetical protein A6D92_01525 [Symbiobacterium thermophilum]|uniref:HAMP domain-containing protein n=1 Tax=Symbiobacterium thermophilum TaxID=2734 RepID=A0A1Y2T6S3_SYMTR|nr:MAG: hypothetical protein A6D92_01525 [Symbiobacterium thermophilum]